MDQQSWPSTFRGGIHHPMSLYEFPQKPREEEDELVVLPSPSISVEIFCVSIYFLLAGIAMFRSFSFSTRFSVQEVEKKHTFQRLMGIFGIIRGISFLFHGLSRNLLNRCALCLFFSLILFQVLFWIDIVNPKVSIRSRRIWNIFIMSNGLFYAFVLGLSIVHVLQMAQQEVDDNKLLSDNNNHHHKSSSSSSSRTSSPSTTRPTISLLHSDFWTGILPVLLIALGSLVSSGGMLYSTCKMQHRVGRILKQSIEDHNKRLDHQIEKKLHRALRLMTFVMGICSLTFLLRTILYLQRPFSHHECGSITNPNICILVGYVFPEVVPCTLFLILTWEVEPKLRMSRRRSSVNGFLFNETTPLLTTGDKEHQKNGTQMTINTNPTAFYHTYKSTTTKNRRSSPLTSGLGGRDVLERARSLGSDLDVNNPTQQHNINASDVDQSLGNFEKIEQNPLENCLINKRALSRTSSVPSAPYMWLSFQCFGLKFPSKTFSSFVVLHLVDSDSKREIVEIGRTEVAYSDDPCFHLMLAVEMSETDILKASVFAVRNQNSLQDLNSQWLIGDTIVPLSAMIVDLTPSISNSEKAASCIGHASLHSLFSPLCRSSPSGELIVRCEAEVRNTASAHLYAVGQRIIRSFMYFADTKRGESSFLQQQEKEKNDSDSVSNCRKLLVEEELIESVYTWEIPYQLLQLILAELLLKLDALKQEEAAEAELSFTKTTKEFNDHFAVPSQVVLTPVHEAHHEQSELSFERDFLKETMQEASGSNSMSTASENDPSGIVTEMIVQIQGDAMERKKRKWRSGLILMMEGYISLVEDAILKYGVAQHGGLTFKPSTMKADSGLSFLALNLHQQLLTVGSAVPTSENDILRSDRIFGSRYNLLVTSFVGSAASRSDREQTERENRLSDIYDIDEEYVAKEDDEMEEEEKEEEDDQQDMDKIRELHRRSTMSPKFGEDKYSLEPKEALRRRVVSFDSAETIVRGQLSSIPMEQRKLAETVVAMGMNKKDMITLQEERQADVEKEKTKELDFEQQVDDLLNVLEEEVMNEPKVLKKSTELAPTSASLRKDWERLDRSAVSDTSSTTTPEEHDPFYRHRMYGTTTVGAFAAHVYGFKNGGIRQMREELNGIYGQLRKENEKKYPSVLTLEALERDYHELKWHVERRLEVAFCQAVSALVTCFQQTLYVHIHQDYGFGVNVLRASGLEYLEMICSIGFLFSVESLLSTYSNEAGMLGDMDVAVKELGKVQIKLRPVTSPRAASFRVAITSGPSGFIIELPLILCDPSEHRDRNMHCIPGQDSNNGAVFFPIMQDTTKASEFETRLKYILSKTIRVVPVLFSQGMNEMQTVANTVGKDSLQKEINAENLIVLQSYFVSFAQYRTTRNGTTNKVALYTAEDFDRWQKLLTQLSQKIHHSGREKCMDILVMSSRIARSIGGGRVICCKSAKDRTAMSVTLEEANLLVECHGLSAIERDAFTRLLRIHGVRIQNARKNIGKAQYCFSALQNYMLPQDYKCPRGTGGGSRSFS